jgi:hypothetical protein
MTPSDLCVACGMCCDGTLFGNVVCSKEEADYMGSLGLETKKKDNQINHVFLTPCSMHINGSCSIYEDPKKPKTCSGYKCALLKRVLRNEITPEQALVKVERVKKAKEDLGVSSVVEARQLKTTESKKFLQDIQLGFYGPKKKK